MSRVLIALNSGHLKRSSLNAAFNYCEDIKLKVDVLLVSEDPEPPALLDGFLSRLNGTRLAPRLFLVRQRPLNQAVLEHVEQHKDIYIILVDGMDWGKGVPLRALRQPVGLISSLAAT